MMSDIKKIRISMVLDKTYYVGGKPFIDLSDTKHGKKMFKSLDLKKVLAFYDARQRQDDLIERTYMEIKQHQKAIKACKERLKQIRQQRVPLAIPLEELQA